MKKVEAGACNKDFQLGSIGLQALGGPSSAAHTCRHSPFELAAFYALAADVLVAKPPIRYNTPIPM